MQLVLKTVVVAFVIATVLCLPVGWAFMLLVGALHSEFGWFRNTISFWPSVGIMLTGAWVTRSLLGGRNS